MSDTPKHNDWSKPAAMAIPKEGFFKLEQGRYGPLFPQYPRVPRLHDHREDQARHGAGGPRVRQEHREGGGGRPARPRSAQAALPALGALRHQGETYFMYQGIFDTDFDKYTEDAMALFSKTGINTVFEKLEGFPEDWKTNAPAFIKFVREHQCPSFLEYGEYPYVSADEIKKALQAQGSLLGHARPDAVIHREDVTCLNSTTFSTFC